jgi:hypothetical protein
VTLDSTFLIITEAPPKEYLTDFGDDNRPPKNAHLHRIDKGVIPGYDGIAILYHPDTTKKAQDCIDGTHVWIHNKKGFVTAAYATITDRLGVVVTRLLAAAFWLVVENR